MARTKRAEPDCGQAGSTPKKRGRAKRGPVTQVCLVTVNHMRASERLGYPVELCTNFNDYELLQLAKTTIGRRPAFVTLFCTNSCKTPQPREGS